MRNILLLLLMLVIIGACACRTRKTGCPTPRRQWGAEKVLEEMSTKKKKH